MASWQTPTFEMPNATFQQKLVFEISIRCGHALPQQSAPTTRTSPLAWVQLMSVKNPKHAKDALVAQCPIVVFKAATVLQSLGIIASRTLLPPSDTQGESREHADCPTEWNYAYGYHAQNDYSNALFEKGAPAILAHECVLSVIAQISNKNPRHPQCANAHAPSSVISGLMVSLTPVFKPKQPRPVKLDDMLEFKSIAEIRAKS